MISAVDTNILLDILCDDPEFGEESRILLEEYSNKGILVISYVVYSELLGFFLKKDDTETSKNSLGEFLRDFDIQIFDFNKEDFVIAAEAWQKFSKKKEVNCAKCGHLNSFNCNKCHSKVLWRNHLITDFIIGAHATTHADILLTRDRGYYKNYFSIKIKP